MSFNMVYEYYKRTSYIYYFMRIYEKVFSQMSDKEILNGF